PVIVNDSAKNDQPFAREPTLAKPQEGNFAPGSTMQPARPIATTQADPSDRYNGIPAQLPTEDSALTEPRALPQFQTPPAASAPSFGPPPGEFKPAPSLMPAIDVGTSGASDQISGIEGGGRPGHKQLEGMQAPSLTLEKIAPQEIQVGKPAVFQIKVRNAGRV